MGSYIPSTKEERRKMLAETGYKDIRSLFADVPDAVYLDKPLNLPAGMSEMQVRAKMQELAGKNRLRPLHSFHCKIHHRQGRICNQLHALPGGNEPGYPAIYF